MFFKKLPVEDQVNTIYSPVIGNAIPIEDVKDDTFAKKLLGDGIAFIWEGDTIYSPCSGIVTLIAKTKHAFGITMDNGTQVLLHIGLDTVNLNGIGMELLIKKATKVKKNKPLLKIDREFMAQNNIDLTIILIITNTPEYEITMEETGVVTLDSAIIRTCKRVK